MKQDWLFRSLALSREPADFYSGARKILRARSFTFKRVKDDLTLADCGYTKSKQSMLVRNYLNEESHNAACKLWARRLEQAKYGSVGFSTYNHLIKGGGLRNSWERSSKITGIPPRPGGTMGGRRKASDPPPPQPKTSRASVMGPCIQSVVLTLLNNKKVAVDVFYRTTELFKKFPADLVFIRDVLLPPFGINDRLQEMNFHFANVTCHPMYFVTMIPLMDDPIAELERIRKADKYFFDWVVKWTARYLCKEYFRGIEKFAQAMRVRKDALERIDSRTMKELTKYLKDNHPGYRNEYEGDDGDEDDV